MPTPLAYAPLYGPSQLDHAWTRLRALRDEADALLPRTFDVSPGRADYEATLRDRTETLLEGVRSTRRRKPAVLGWVLPRPSPPTALEYGDVIARVHRLCLADLGDRAKALHQAASEASPPLLRRIWKGWAPYKSGRAELDRAGAKAKGVGPNVEGFEDAARRYLQAMRLLHEAYEARNPMGTLMLLASLIGAAVAVLGLCYRAVETGWPLGAEPVESLDVEGADDPVRRRRGPLQTPPPRPRQNGSASPPQDEGPACEAPPFPIPDSLPAWHPGTAPRQRGGTAASEAHVIAAGSWRLVSPVGTLAGLETHPWSPPPYLRRVRPPSYPSTLRDIRVRPDRPTGLRIALPTDLPRATVARGAA